MKPRLSICIATYLRAKYLDESLRSIVEQGMDGVEVVIVDGASPDETAAVVEPYTRRFPGQVHYHREAVKGGVDLDYAKAVSYARGDYCWLLSDDDPLKPGALSAVLAALSAGVSLVVVNAEVRNADLSRRLEERRLRIDRDRDIAELGELFAVAVDYLTFIGGVVIDRELWNSRPHAAYLGSEFIHLGVIFQAPLPRPARILAEPFITLRYGNAQWSARSFEIWMCKYPRLIWSFEAVPQAARQAATPRDPWRNLARVFSFRAKGSYDLDVYRRIIRPLAPAWPLRCLLAAIAWFPGVLANATAYAAFSLKPRCSPLNWVDLGRSRYNVVAKLGLRRKEGI